ncbi:hypothetical protein RLEG3_07345 (plasmid) [Rhizobium leguminosarum bv. trifolii WSM1689]|nr:hypothetical protein RLEG3_07345 [Rhizobium leguminosarum bv. trifolii WSM1689]
MHLHRAGRFDHLAAAAWMLLPIPLGRQSFGRELLRALQGTKERVYRSHLPSVLPAISLLAEKSLIDADRLWRQSFWLMGVLGHRQCAEIGSHERHG